MFPKNILQFLFIFLISIVCCAPLVPLFLTNKENKNLTILVFFICTLSIFIGLVHYINYKKKIKIKYKIKPINTKLSLYYILIIWVTVTVIFRPIHYYFFSKSYQIYDFYYILGALILAPILEEIVFRNILLNSLLNSHSKNKSIIISSLLFAFVHGSPYQIIFTTIIGLFLGAIYAKEKNIGYTIMLHFFANFFVFISQFYVQKYFNSPFFNILIYLNMTISFLLLIFMHKKYDYSIIKTINPNK